MSNYLTHSISDIVSKIVRITHSPLGIFVQAPLLIEKAIYLESIIAFI